MSRETLTIPQGAGTALRDFALDVQQLTDAHSVRLANLEAKSRQDTRQTGGGFARWPWGTWTIAANTQLPDGAACRVHLINCTSPSDITLPTCKHGDWIVLVNAGASTATIKDGGTTLCTLPTDTLCFIKAYTTSAFAPQWPTKVETWKRDGTLTLAVPPVITGLTASRLVVTDSGGALASNAALVNTGVVYATGTGGVISAATLTYVDPLLTAFANSIGATSTAAFALSNTTAATSGNQKFSPALDWIGQGFGTGLPGSSKSVRFRAECVPVQGSGNPTGTFTISSSVDTGAPSFTSRLTLTTAGVLTVAALVGSSSITNSALTATRVVYSGTAGLQVDSANFTFDGSKLSLAATGSSGGVLIGGDCALYRLAADQWFTGDYFQSTGPNFTSTSATQANINSTANFAPSSNTSGRMWALYFATNGSTNNNFTDSTGGLVGLEGGVTHSGSGTVTSLSAGILNTQASSTGTVTTGQGLHVLGFDGSSGATVTTYNGVRSDSPRLSGAGTVTTSYAFVCHPRTVSTGVITNHIGLGVFPAGNMNAHNANNQTRFGIDIGAMPSPGAFTGTTTAAIRIQGTGGSRDGILFSDVRAYRSASGILACDGDVSAVTAGKGFRVAEGSNCKMGTAVLVAGAVTVSTTAVTANSRIFLCHNVQGGTLGSLSVSARTAGTSFAIASTNVLDTSTIAWILFEPA